MSSALFPSNCRITIQDFTSVVIIKLTGCVEKRFHAGRTNSLHRILEVKGAKPSPTPSSRATGRGQRDVLEPLKAAGHCLVPRTGQVRSAICDEGARSRHADAKQVVDARGSDGALSIPWTKSFGCLSGRGPVYLAAGSVCASSAHRRVGNVYYEGFLRQLLLSASLNALQMQYQLDGNDLVHLMHTHAKTMFGVAADAWEAPDMELWRNALYTQMVRRGELQVLAGDGTMKVCKGLKGQLRRRDGGGPKPAEQGGGAWNANDTYTVIHSVWTSLGGTLGLETVQGDTGADTTRSAVSCIHKIAGQPIAFVVALVARRVP